MEVEDEDVVVSSGVKMGTTWLARVLVSLLYDDDDDDDENENDECDNDGGGGPTTSGGGSASSTTNTTARTNTRTTATTTSLCNNHHHHRHPGRRGQTYPDATYPTRTEKADDDLGIYDRVPDGRCVADSMFGDFVWEDLLDMPRPRLFVSHLFGRRYLPRMLFDDVDDDGDGDEGDDGVDEEDGDGEARGCEWGSSGSSSTTRRRIAIARGGKRGGRGRGRLIVMVRNLRDTLVSLHNFRGVAMDGMLGNEFGPGSFARFVDDVDECPNAMGSAFLWVRQNAEAVRDVGHDRALVVYYERLVSDFAGTVRGINDFLGLRHLTDAKVRSIEEACSLGRMRDDADFRTRENCRSGGVGGWKDVEELNYEEHWSRFDDVFDRVLGGVEIAEPLRS